MCIRTQLRPHHKVNLAGWYIHAIQGNSTAGLIAKRVYVISKYADQMGPSIRLGRLTLTDVRARVIGRFRFTKNFI